MTTKKFEVNSPTSNWNSLTPLTLAKEHSISRLGTRFLQPFIQTLSSVIVWFGDANDDGYMIGYASIVVHAISTDSENFHGRRGIYMQLGAMEEDDEEMDNTFFFSPMDESKGKDRFTTVTARDENLNICYLKGKRCVLPL